MAGSMCHPTSARRAAEEIVSDCFCRRGKNAREADDRREAKERRKGRAKQEWRDGPVWQGEPANNQQESKVDEARTKPASKKGKRGRKHDRRSLAFEKRM